MCIRDSPQDLPVRARLERMTYLADERNIAAKYVEDVYKRQKMTSAMASQPRSPKALFDHTPQA